MMSLVGLETTTNSLSMCSAVDTWGSSAAAVRRIVEFVLLLVDGSDMIGFEISAFVDLKIKIIESVTIRLYTSLVI